MTDTSQETKLRSYNKTQIVTIKKNKAIKNAVGSFMCYIMKRVPEMKVNRFFFCISCLEIHVFNKLPISLDHCLFCLITPVFFYLSLTTPTA